MIFIYYDFLLWTNTIVSKISWKCSLSAQCCIYNDTYYCHYNHFFLIKGRCQKHTEGGALNLGGCNQLWTKMRGKHILFRNGGWQENLTWNGGWAWRKISFELNENMMQMLSIILNDICLSLVPRIVISDRNSWYLIS